MQTSIHCKVYDILPPFTMKVVNKGDSSHSGPEPRACLELLWPQHVLSVVVAEERDSGPALLAEGLDHCRAGQMW